MAIRYALYHDRQVLDNWSQLLWTLARPARFRTEGDGTARMFPVSPLYNNPPAPYCVRVDDAVSFEPKLPGEGEVGYELYLAYYTEAERQVLALKEGEVVAIAELIPALYEGQEMSLADIAPFLNSEGEIVDEA